MSSESSLSLPLSILLKSGWAGPGLGLSTTESNPGPSTKQAQIKNQSPAWLLKPKAQVQAPLGFGPDQSMSTEIEYVIEYIGIVSR